MLLANSVGLIICFTLYLCHVNCMSSFEDDNNADWGNSSTCLSHQFFQTDEDQINYIRVHSVSTVILVVQKLDWKRIVVLSDDKWDTYVDDLVETLYEMGVRLVRYTMDTSHTVHGTSQIFTILKERYDHNILLLAQTDRIRSLFELVNAWERSCFSQNTHWLVVSEDEKLDERLPLNYCTHHVLVVQWYSMENICPFQHVNSNKESRIVVKLMTSSVSGQSRNLETVQDWHIEGDYPSSMDEIVPVEKLYPNGQIGLGNRTLRVGVLPAPAYMAKYYVNNETVYSGIAIEYLKELASLLNFRFELSEPSDGEFGRLVNESWTGAIRMLLRKEIDVIGFPLSYEKRRQAVVDYVYPFFYERYYVYFRPLNESEARWSVLFKTFTWPVVSITMSLLIVLASFAAVESLQQRRLRSRTKAEIWFREWLTSLTAILLKQGDVAMPHMKFSKALWALWAYGCLIVAAFIGANLMASLAVSHAHSPFSTLEEFIANEEYSLGIPSGGFAELLLKTSTEKIYQKLWDKVLKSAKKDGMSTYLEWKADSTLKLADHLAKMNKEKYAFMVDQMTMFGRCNVDYLPESLGVVPAGFAFPKGSPYTNKFSQVTRMLHQLGIIARNEKEKLRKIPACPQHVTTVRKLDITDLKAVFYVLITLASAAFIALIVETVVFRVRRC